MDEQLRIKGKIIEEDYFKQDEVLENKFKLYSEENLLESNEINTFIFRDEPRYLRILGFNYRYDIEVLDNPINCGDLWKYKVKVADKILYWFNIRLWKL